MDLFRLPLTAALSALDAAGPASVTSAADGPARALWDQACKEVAAALEPKLVVAPPPPVAPAPTAAVETPQAASAQQQQGQAPGPRVTDLRAQGNGFGCPLCTLVFL